MPGLTLTSITRRGYVGSGAGVLYSRRGLEITPRVKLPFTQLGFAMSPYSSAYYQRMYLPMFSPQINQEGSAMYKTNRMGLIFLLPFLLATGSSAYTAEKPASKATEQSQPITSSSLKGVEWVRLCLEQYPEIRWLADENVRKTEEGQASLQGTYSEQLFGKKFIEFDRTIMSLHCLRLILDGSDTAYQEFVKDQPENIKLSKQSFQRLHKQGVALTEKLPGMSRLEVVQAMEAALVLGDLGKTGEARKKFKPYGAQAPDHDDFHGEVIQILQGSPELSPTFNRLSPAGKKLITETANLAHYGHIIHIEGGPSMFSKLKKSNLPNSSPLFLLFDFFMFGCDAAAALGHVNNRSSLVCTETTHLAMQAVLESCEVLADPEKTEMDAYNAYLAIRADLLGLNIEDRTDRVLTRMGTMLRLFTKEEGEILKQAVLKLPEQIRTQIIEQLDARQGEELERTPTYMPAVLVNLANNPELGSSKEEKLSQAVILGLPFIAKVLETHKQHLDASEADPSIPLNFNRAAGVAKTNPGALSGEYAIDLEGNVSIVTP